MSVSLESSLIINGRFSLRRTTGVERYAHEISSRMESLARFQRPSSFIKGMTGHLWEQLVLPSVVKRDDILWSPANSGPLRVMNQVVTIHDLAVIEHPEWFSFEFASWYRLFLARLIKRVACIVTPSNFSRHRILEMFRLPEDSVIVVPGGVDQTIFYPRDSIEQKSVRKKYQITTDYILFVGSIEPRKNLAGLIAAWNLISGSFPDIELLIAGGANNSFRKIQIKRSNLQIRLRLLGYVDDEDLPALYSGAVAFIQPSYYEGFGLSLLEAMACGTPVISSRAGALSELVDGNCLLFDPLDIEGLAEILSQTLEDSSLRRNLTALGLPRAHQFSWKSSASQMRRLFADLRSRA